MDIDKVMLTLSVGKFEVMCEDEIVPPEIFRMMLMDCDNRRWPHVAFNYSAIKNALRYYNNHSIDEMTNEDALSALETFYNTSFPVTSFIDSDTAEDIRKELLRIRDRLGGNDV